MRYLDLEHPRRNRVMAVFRASALTFDIAPAATLADLVERLAGLRRETDGTVVSVAIRVRPERQTNGH